MGWLLITVDLPRPTRVRRAPRSLLMAASVSMQASSISGVKRPPKAGSAAPFASALAGVVSGQGSVASW